MKNSSTNRLFSYFNGLRDGRPAPLRSEIEPAHLKSILPDVFMLETRSSGSVHVRLAGTRVCAIMGRELRGEDFNFLWCKTDRHRMKLAAEAVLANQVPLRIDLRALGEDESAMPLEMLLLPLYSRPGRLDRYIGMLSAAEQTSPVREQPRLLRPDRLEFVDATIAATPDWQQHASHISVLRSKAMQLRVLSGGRID